MGDQVFAVTEHFCENNGVDCLLLNMLKQLNKCRICIKGPQSLYDCNYGPRLLNTNILQVAELQCKLNSQPCTDSYVKVRALIRKK